MADTLTISVPATMAEQMERAQRNENRTRSQLLREAWREYFESHYGGYTATRGQLAAIRKGRAEIRRGEYKTLQELRSDLDNSHRKAGGKAARKVPAKSRRLLLDALEEMQKNPFGATSSA